MNLNARTIVASLTLIAALILSGCAQRFGPSYQSGSLGPDDSSRASIQKDSGRIQYIVHVLPLFNFPGNDYGSDPVAGLVGDPSSVLFGATTNGGSSTACGGGCGVIFELKKGPNGGYQESVIHSFSQSDGAFPVAPLVEDANNNIYGTTESGGQYGLGTVFEISGGGSQFQTLYSFQGGSDGAVPTSTPVIDRNGNIFGTTLQGGAFGCGTSGCCPNNCGTVYELVNNAGVYTERVIYAFKWGTDGWYPWGSLLASNGVLYGTTFAGGNSDSGCGYSGSGCGTVFQVVSNGSTYSEHVLHRFQPGMGGQHPNARLIANSGELFGETQNGGSSNCTGGCGTLFSLTMSSTPSFQVIHRFAGGKDGVVPYVGLAEANNVLYGTTIHGGNSATCGGATGCGVLFSVNPDGSSYAILHDFAQPADGGIPDAAVFVDNVDQQVYGTVGDGGKFGFGYVFSVQ